MVKNVLMLCWSFPPAAGSGVYRSAKFAKYLPQMGWKPIVVTSLEALASGGRDRSLLDELPDDVEVVYTPRTSAAVRSLERLLNTVRMDWVQDLMEFPDPFVHWIPQAVRAVCRLVGRRRIHAVYTTVDPFSTGLAGLILKKVTRLPWVIDYRDPWTVIPRWWRWQSTLHLALARRLEREVVRSADAVIMNTPTAAELMVEEFGDEGCGKILWIPNGFDAEDLPRNVPEESADARFTIAYTGRFFRTSVDYTWPGHPIWSKIAQRLQVLPEPTLVRNALSPLYFLQAVREAISQDPVVYKHLRVELAGRMPSDSFDQIERLRLKQVVRFRGYLPKRQSVKLLTKSSMLFLPHGYMADGRPMPTVPGKAYEYMATGKPILAAVAPGDLMDFLTKAELGIFCHPTDVTGMAEKIIESLHIRQNGGLRTNPNWQFINQFERKKLTKRLAEVLYRICQL